VVWVADEISATDPPGGARGCALLVCSLPVPARQPPIQASKQSKRSLPPGQHDGLSRSLFMRNGVSYYAWRRLLSAACRNCRGQRVCMHSRRLRNLRVHGGVFE
jgi:hypothetical protein